MDDHLPLELPALPNRNFPDAVTVALGDVKNLVARGFRLLQQESTDPIQLKVAIDLLHDKGPLLDQLVEEVDDEEWTRALATVIFTLEARLQAKALHLTTQ